MTHSQTGMQSISHRNTTGTRAVLRSISLRSDTIPVDVGLKYNPPFVDAFSNVSVANMTALRAST